MRTTESQTIQTFQELRSFMQREQLTDKDRVNLWTLLQDAHASSTKEYEDTWLPYLTGFPHHFQQPLTRVYSEKELSKAVSIAPCATFEVFLFKVKNPNDIDSLIDSDAFSQVSSLICDNTPFQDAHLRKLAHHPHAKNITSLHFNHCEFSSQALHDLGQAIFTHHLQHLHLSFMEFDEANVSSFIASAQLHNLESLRFMSNSLTYKAFHEFSTSSCVNSLKLLQIKVNSIRHEGLATLLNTPFQNLTSLDISNTNMHSLEGIEHATWLERLTSLDISGNWFPDDEIERLAKTPALHNLQHLNLNDTMSSSQSFAAIAQSPHLNSLRTLRFAESHPGMDGIEALVSPNNRMKFKYLDRLDLCNTALQPQEVAKLVNSSIIDHVTHLDLSSNEVGPEGARALAQSPHTRSLQHLNLYDTQLDDDALIALINSPYLDNLQSIDLEGNLFEERGLNLLKMTNNPVFSKCYCYCV